MNYQIFSEEDAPLFASVDPFLLLTRKMTIFTQVSHLRNTAYGARGGESKSLPRDPGFRVRVTYTQKVRGAYSLCTSVNPQISACTQQV